MKKIAWIGVGIMGTPMVEHLLKAGFQVHITARNRAKVEGVIQAGAVFHDTIGQCVQGCQAVVTMVGYPKDVEEVYFAPGNILDRAEAGAYLIDMTTTSPALAQRLAAEGTKRGFRVLDAPVTGGDVGAPGGDPLHPGGGRGGGLCRLPAPFPGHGDQHHPPGGARLRPARQAGQPDHDRRDPLRPVRGGGLCPGPGAGRGEAPGCPGHRGGGEPPAGHPGGQDPGRGTTRRGFT